MSIRTTTTDDDDDLVKLKLEIATNSLEAASVTQSEEKREQERLKAYRMVRQARDLL